MTDTGMAFGEIEFDRLLQSVLQERRFEAAAPAGLEQRLTARLAQQRQLDHARPFGFAERPRTPRSAMATWFAVTAHAVALLALLVVASRQVAVTTLRNVALIELTTPALPPPIAPRAAQLGGGGGHHDVAPASKGHLPRLAPQQIMAPAVPPAMTARLEVEPAVVVQKDLKMADNTLPNLGSPGSSLHGVSVGDGSGTGLGSGYGAGIGPGSGGNAGGGLFHVGGGVSKPVLLYEPEAEYSEEARKAKFSGNVEVYLWVDEKGSASHIRVVHSAGLGLDEKAIEAVRQYRFKPATKDGKPVRVDLYVDVNFQIL